MSLQTSSQGTEDELDEGQEEWLSEGILTDDDGNTMVCIIISVIHFCKCKLCISVF